MRKTVLSACVSVSFLILSACGVDSSQLISSIRGTLVPSTFDSEITSVTATNETSTQVISAVASDGTFSLALPKDHEWQLSVNCKSGSVPLVFPRADGRLDATFALSTTNADIDLGQIKATTGMGQVKVNSSALTAAECEGVCVDDSTSASVTCVTPTGDEGHSCGGGGKKGEGHRGPPPEFADGGRPDHAHGPPPEFADGGRPDHPHGPPPGFADGGRPPHPPRGPKSDAGERPTPRQHDASLPFAVAHQNPPRDVAGCEE
jgi:hypothetical protein